MGFSIPTHLKISVPKYGYRVYCPINVSNAQFINLTTHEEEIIEHFQPVKGDVIVDIGAYVGRYTLIASKRVGLDGKVISIEANPNNFEMLNRNVRLNSSTNVIALNYAIYSQATKIKLYLPDERSGRFNTLMPGRANKGKAKFVEINAITLDHLLQLQGINQVDWIKIDVEGAELEVLKGASSIISQSKGISLLIEIHNLSGSNTTLYEPITKFLRFHNFNIDFQRTYEGGERHVIARKRVLL